jgi:hypothetical protein
VEAAVKTQRIKSAAWLVQASRNERGIKDFAAVRGLCGSINLLRIKKRRTPSMRGAAVGVGPLLRRFVGVDSVHKFGFGLGRTLVGSGRIPHVSAGGQCLQGLECSSSPTSGTCFPSSEGFCF